MEGLELGSAGPASNYGPLDPMEVGGPGSVPPDMAFDNMGDLPPQPPRDNNQVRSAGTGIDWPGAGVSLLVPRNGVKGHCS